MTSEGAKDWVTKVSHITFADFNLYLLALTNCNHEYYSLQLISNEPEQITKHIRKPVIVNEGHQKQQNVKPDQHMWKSLDVDYKKRGMFNIFK